MFLTNEEVRAALRASDWQTWSIGVLLIGGCFYGLYFVPAIDATQRGGLYGLLGLVASYFLSKHTSDAAAMKAVSTANGHTDAATVAAAAPPTPRP